MHVDFSVQISVASASTIRSEHQLDLPSHADLLLVPSAIRLLPCTFPEAKRVNVCVYVRSRYHPTVFSQTNVQPNNVILHFVSSIESELWSPNHDAGGRCMHDLKADGDAP